MLACPGMAIFTLASVAAAGILHAQADDLPQRLAGLRLREKRRRFHLDDAQRLGPEPSGRPNATATKLNSGRYGRKSHLHGDIADGGFVGKGPVILPAPSGFVWSNRHAVENRRVLQVSVGATAFEHRQKFFVFIVWRSHLGICRAAFANPALGAHLSGNQFENSRLTFLSEFCDTTIWKSLFRPRGLVFFFFFLFFFFFFLFF